jgi:hypothetical protein
MDPLGGVSPVMELLRRQMSENLERLRKSGGMPAGTRALPQVASRPVAQTLRQSLVTRIKALDADDPHYQQRATAAFVESVLRAEFGDAAIDDPDFRLVIRDVATTMGADGKVANDLALLFAELAEG